MGNALVFFPPLPLPSVLSKGLPPLFLYPLDGSGAGAFLPLLFFCPPTEPNLFFFFSFFAVSSLGRHLSFFFFLFFLFHQEQIVQHDHRFSLFPRSSLSDRRRVLPEIFPPFSPVKRRSAPCCLLSSFLFLFFLF